MVDARHADLDDRGLSSLQHVEQFGEATSSSVLYLTLQSMGIANITADHAASHIGRAQVHLDNFETYEWLAVI
jgi:NADH dehydrogenase [ubiquinone] 1 alpha subcomplex assembly factor 6